MIIGEGKLNETILKYPNEVILLIFSASWCGPCKMLKKKLLDETDDYVRRIKDLKYAIIDADADENMPICKYYGVKGIPHQVFIKLVPDNNGNYNVKILDQIIGYDLIGLVNKYEKLVGKNP